jgi:ABC-type multidrug transport system ATPase subunit
MDDILANIGVCPQFDIFYPDLSCREHLLFYARLKGLAGKAEQLHVNEILTSVGLTQAANRQAKALSGGMRRRLSMGIALIGRPRLLFLDEPTTGLDPLTRRQLWDVFLQIREDRRSGHQARPDSATGKGKSLEDGGLSIVLTTHAMDEADVLCDRIGIMSNGQLKCIGPQEYLKQKFSIHYALTVDVEVLHQEFVSPRAIYGSTVPLPPTSDNTRPVEGTARLTPSKGSIANFIQSAIRSEVANMSRESGFWNQSGHNRLGHDYIPVDSAATVRFIQDQSTGSRLTFQILAAPKPPSPPKASVSELSGVTGLSLPLSDLRADGSFSSALTASSQPPEIQQTTSSGNPLCWSIVRGSDDANTQNASQRKFRLSSLFRELNAAKEMKYVFTVERNVPEMFPLISRPEEIRSFWRRLPFYGQRPIEIVSEVPGITSVGWKCVKDYVIVKDWGLNMTTLEDVFVQVVRENGSMK